MVFYSSVHLTVLTYFFISISCASYSGRQNIRSPRSDEAPECEADYVYDPTVGECVEEEYMVECGENMVFKKTPSSEEVSCVCQYEAQVSGWGRPQALSKTESSCHNLGERVSLCNRKWKLKFMAALFQYFIQIWFSRDHAEGAAY